MAKITLVLHNIRSTYNVGAIFRTAEGFGVSKIIISGYTPYPTHGGDTRVPHIAEKISAQIHKTALGAESMVPFEQYDNILTWLDANTLPVVALEQAENSINLREYIPPHEFALLLGEEVHGIEAQLLKKVSAVIEIPMYGKKESFNVSVAAGIALYALS